MGETKLIDFYGDHLLGVRTEDNKVWMAVRSTCTDIGLTTKQAENEIKKIKSSLLFKTAWEELCLKFKGQVRKVTVLQEKLVPMWLAQINITPNMQKRNPEAAKKLLTYQLEAADALHEAFADTIQERMGMQGEIVDAVNNLNENVSRLIDSCTINTYQQQQLLILARRRVNFLLGGNKSVEYKNNSRTYFKNMWLNFCNQFQCGSYKDLNPVYFAVAEEYIKKWTYK